MYNGDLYFSIFIEAKETYGIGYAHIINSKQHMHMETIHELRHGYCRGN